LRSCLWQPAGGIERRDSGVFRLRRTSGCIRCGRSGEFGGVPGIAPCCVFRASRRPDLDRSNPRFILLEAAFRVAEGRISVNRMLVERRSRVKRCRELGSDETIFSGLGRKCRCPANSGKELKLGCLTPFRWAEAWLNTASESILCQRTTRRSFVGRTVNQSGLACHLKVSSSIMKPFRICVEHYRPAGAVVEE